MLQLPYSLLSIEFENSPDHVNRIFDVCYTSFRAKGTRYVCQIVYGMVYYYSRYR